ncbi:MAG: isoprenoid biosynthesis glyoxalase ElbB [Pseudomonadales bacterium]|nr:isoprenoid biosynthesis glyoxalase ElbB [Pseudomonadales bacterium]
MAKVAVVLSGCGVYDGSEVYESVCTLFALDKANAEVQCFAPNIQQMHVINHLTGEVMPGETRNVLIEAGRISRGQVKDLIEAKAEDFDALIVPGGFGAAKNLSDFALKGADCSVNPDFLKFAQAMHHAGKPIGLICIAPALAVAICGKGVECTIGNDAETAATLVAMGAVHRVCPVEKACIDKNRKLVTTPAYMLADRISEAATGIEQCVAAVLALI